MSLFGVAHASMSSFCLQTSEVFGQASQAGVCLGGACRWT